MSKILMAVMILGFSVFMFAQEEAAEAEAQHSYVGVKACGMCHKTAKQGEQLKIWENSPHAQAYETLKSDESAKIAKEMGLEVPAYEAGECLKCHLTEYGVDEALLDAKYEKNMGVQCESCHGAGSDYKKMSIMKDRQQSIDNGMRPILVSDGSAAEFCVTCHNEESPTFKGFEFDEMWKQIAHPVPASK